MENTLHKLEQFLTDIEPHRSSGKSEEQNAEERRDKALEVVDDAKQAVLEDQAVMRTRQTSNGPILYNTNIYFRAGGMINIQLKMGFKSLSINGKKTFSAPTKEGAIQMLGIIKEAIKDGSLDESLRALYEIPDETLRKMQDMKAIKRFAKAKVGGAALTTDDRIKLERLLRNPAYRDTYNALTA